MITITRLAKSFNSTKVVGDISLTIKPGEIVGLLGPNGAGKTTTIRMIAGVLPPTSGRVEIDGKNYKDNEAEIKRRIGYLPENNPLYDELTVEEHLNFWADMKALTGEERAAAIDFAIQKTGIAEVYYRLIGELSKGFRQRVGLSQAILARPDILLLDEPTEGLDPNQRRDIQKLLAELGQHRTVIVSSHVLGEISKLATRIMIINKGEVVGDDTLDKLLLSREGTQTIKLEVTGTGIMAGLKSLKGVTEVEPLEKNTYIVTIKQKADYRPEIFKLAVNKKWTLLTMLKLERQLEDVFSELTEE